MWENSRQMSRKMHSEQVGVLMTILTHDGEAKLEE